MLEKSAYNYSREDKLWLADKKNGIYRQLLTELTPGDILPGAIEFAEEARKSGLKIAIGSSSRNTPVILEKIGLSGFFDAVADGNDIKKSKPDPEVFLIASRRIGVSPGECLVVEDADAGVEAAKAGGMLALAVGAAETNPMADFRAPDMQKITLKTLLSN